MNKVILIQTGETPSLGPSYCFTCLILSFALHLANLYEVPTPKCEGDDNSEICFLACLLDTSSLIWLSANQNYIKLEWCVNC